MRRAITAITEELRRLKAAGQGTVTVSDEGLAALRKAVEARPKAALPKAAANAERPEATRPVPRAAAKEVKGEVVLPAPPLVVLPPGDKAMRWAALNQLVQDDPVCRARVRPGKKIVTGVGNLDATIMLIGEAPGAEEEVQGEPFVGPAGQLLGKMIGGMALSRADLYIGNIMNWRPEMEAGPDGVQTGNRPPTDAEMAYCIPYLLAQVEIVAPQILVALGASAAKALLGPKSFSALGDIRGRWHDFGGRPLMVTYHPSYILRNPINKTKRLIWEDLLKVMERAKLPITDKQRAFFLS